MRSRIFVSPNVGQDLPIEKSVLSLRGSEQARFRSMTRDLLSGMGEAHNAVGAWVDGSEPVVASIFNGDPQAARKVAGRLGQAAKQKAVLVFHEDENGPQVIHDVQVHGTDLASIHKSLIAHGVNQHTITPGQHSSVVSVYDQDGSQGPLMATFARASHGHHTQTKGTGEFLGDPAWSSRAKATQEYAKLSRVRKSQEEVGWDRVYVDHPVFGSETIREFLGRHNVLIDPATDTIKAYHGRPKGSKYDTLKAGSYIAFDPKSAAHFAGRDRGLSEKQVEVIPLTLRHDHFTPGIHPTLDKPYPLIPIKKARTNEPHPVIHDHARDYMAQAGLRLDESPLEYAPLDKNVAGQVAQHYESSPHDPNHPEVAKAYGAFKKETLAQYQHLKGRGVKLEPWASEGQPYQNSQEMVNDVHGNNHLHYFTGGDMPADHPLAEATGLVEGGKPITYNDAFRAVHDFYGHATYGNEFGPRGEEHAWRAHKRMYSPEAQPAMTFETKGQNSWVNFGPHSHLPATQRPFAQQKANLLQLARRAVDRVRKSAALSDWPQLVDHWLETSGLHGKTLGILGDYLEENSNPNHPALRTPEGLHSAYTDWYWKKYPKGLQHDGQKFVPVDYDLTKGQLATQKKTQSDSIKPQLAKLWGTGMENYTTPTKGAGSFTEFLHELPYHQQSPAPVKREGRVRKAKTYETPEDVEHREAETALDSGIEPTKDIVGKLKPGTKKSIGGKDYLRSMDGPYELTEVDPKSFGHRPQKYRNQVIIDKYRDQIKRALAAGKSPKEVVEPVQGEPFQRDDINGGQPTNYLRDGNHRADAAIAEGVEKIPAWFPMRKARLRALLMKLKRGRSPNSPSRLARSNTSVHPSIEVPDPLTTNGHQHWMGFNLQPHEQQAVDKSKALGAHVQEQAPMSMMLHSTLAGRHGRHWYDENHDILKAATHHSSDPRDFVRLAGLEAATSPNNGIMPNQHSAYDLFRIWHMGAMVNGKHIPARTEDKQEVKDLIDGYAKSDMSYPPDYKVPELRGEPLMKKGPHPKPDKRNGGVAKFIHTQSGWQPVPIFYPGVHGLLAHKALTEPDKYADPNRVGGFTGRPEKADSFFRNKLGNQHAVTIDRHEARGYGFELGSKRPDGSRVSLHPGLYHFLVGTGRHIARLLNHPNYNPLSEHPVHGSGWTGARGQAARWMTMRGIRDALSKGAPPEEAATKLKANDIYNISSFVQMFNDPAYMPRLKTMMAEGSLSPDFLTRVKKVEAMYKPSLEELSQTVGHPELVPLARKIAVVLKNQQKAIAATKREAVPLKPGKKK